MDRKRNLKKATPAPWRASFFEAFLRVAFFQAKTLFELLQQASNRKPESPNRARKATTAPRRAFANEKPRDEIIKEICAKSHPKREPKSHDSPEESIESKGQPQPGNRLPEAPQRPQEVSRRPQEAPRKYQEAPNSVSLSLPRERKSERGRENVRAALAAHAPARWSRPRSLVTTPVAGHAPQSLVTPPVAGHAPGRCLRTPVAGPPPVA